ncbi:hypothetical protein ACX818_001334 [Acinetobacter baumannii]
MAGYHETNIGKSSILSPYKLKEEAIEFIDALASNNRIMAMVELSDLYGALKFHATRLGVSLGDLESMSRATVGAFESKDRPSFGEGPNSWLKWIHANSDSIDHKKYSTVFTVQDCQYMIFKDGCDIMPMDKAYTHIIEVIHGVMHVAGVGQMQPGEVLHFTNQHIKCHKGTIARVTSTIKPKYPMKTKEDENLHNIEMSKIRKALGITL